jgi:hypothetical protein
MERKDMTVKQAKRIAVKEMPARFKDLVALLPPHVIRDEEDYDSVIAFMDKLLARPKLSKGQTEFFETWSTLVGEYEDEHHAIDIRDSAAGSDEIAASAPCWPAAPGRALAYMVGRLELVRLRRRAPLRGQEGTTLQTM